MAVIETDGAIEQADSIKVAYDGAPATGFDIFANTLSEAAGHPAIQARQLGLDGLSQTCRRCPVVASCGGGLYAHRYKTGNGFDNTSVYCADLEKIIKHVQARIIPTQPAAQAAAGVQAPGARRLPPRRLPDADFDALAAGFGDGDSVAQLIKAQRTERRKLLQLLRVRARANADELFLAGWARLAQLGKEHPAALDRVLAHPYVRAWAEHCLRAGDTAALPADAAHLAAIAAAAAIRAGAPGRGDGPGQRRLRPPAHARPAAGGSGPDGRDHHRRQRFPGPHRSGQVGRPRHRRCARGGLGAGQGAAIGDVRGQPGRHRSLPGLPSVAGHAAAGRGGRRALAGTVRRRLAADRVGATRPTRPGCGRACPRSCRCPAAPPDGTSAPPPGRPSARSGWPARTTARPWRCCSSTSSSM